MYWCDQQTYLLDCGDDGAFEAIDDVVWITNSVGTTFGALISAGLFGWTTFLPSFQSGEIFVGIPWLVPVKSLSQVGRNVHQVVEP